MDDGHPRLGCNRDHSLIGGCYGRCARVRPDTCESRFPSICNLVNFACHVISGKQVPLDINQRNSEDTAHTGT